MFTQVYSHLYIYHQLRLYNKAKSNHNQQEKVGYGPKWHHSICSLRTSFID